MIDTRKSLKPTYTNIQQEYIINEAGFTDLEKKVFKMKMNGMSNLEIGFEIGRCDRMVTLYLRNIKNKIGRIEIPK